MRRLLLAAVVALGVAAPAQAAAPRRLGSAEGFPFLSLSGGQVVYGSTAFDGDRTKIAVYLQPLAGGTPRRIFSDSYLPFDQLNADVDDTEGESVAASPQAIAVASESAQETGVAASGDADLDFGPVGGRRAPVEHCHDEEGEPSFDGSYLVGGTHLAWISQCGSQAGDLLARDLTGAVRVISPPTAQPLRIVGISGDELAYTTGAITHVINLATGAASDVPAAADQEAVQADGKVAIAANGSCPLSLSWFDAAAHPLGNAHPCDALSFTGDRVLYRDSGLVLHAVDLAGADRSFFPVVDYAADGDDAVVVAGGCSVDTLYAITLDGSTSAPTTPATCPVRVRSRRLRVRGSRLRVRVACPQGCDADIGLSRTSSKRSSAVASGHVLVVPPHRTGTAVVRLGVTARRGLRGTHRRYLSITAKPGPVAPVRTQRVRVTVAG